MAKMKQTLPLSVLIAVFAMAGCTTVPVVRIDAHKELGFVVNPVLPGPEATPGEHISVRVEIYNVTDHEISVPDPSKLLLTFENVGSNDPMMQMPPFSLDGPPPEPPRREISLKPWAVVSGLLTFDVPADASGIYLIREYYYGTVSVALRIRSREPNKTEPNQPPTPASGTPAAGTLGL